MPIEYELIRYCPEFKTQIAALQTHLWSPSLELNSAYFEWKYERNPYVKEPLVYLMMHQGAVIGMRGFHGIQLEAGLPAKQFTELYADDMVIAPRHRKRGHTSEIMAFAFEDLATRKYDFVVNLSAGPQTFRSSLSMGWRSAGWMHPMRWRSWGTALESRTNAMLGRLARVSRKFGDPAFRRPQPSFRPLTTADLTRLGRASGALAAIAVAEAPRCEAMSDLARRMQVPGQTRYVKSAEYFAWRFQNPLSRYRFVYWGEARLEGYLVLQEYTAESASREIVNIVEWEASNETIEAGLLRCAIAMARGKRLVIWTATMPRGQADILQRAGFKSLGPPVGVGPPALLVRPIRDRQLNEIWTLAGMPLLDLAGWDLSMLCSMIG